MTRLYEEFAYSDAPRLGCGWGAVSAPQAPLPARVDTLIIGAGFTGLSAALDLAEAGREVLVIDAAAPGWGASGRNGVFCCLGGALLSFDQIARGFGQEAADAFLAAQLAAIDLVRTRLDAWGIDAARHSDGEVQIAHRARHMRGFEAAAAHHRAHGIEAEVLSRADLEAQGARIKGAHGGIYLRAGFGLDPSAYVTGLAEAARGAGAEIIGGTQAERIREDANGLTVQTNQGDITATQVLIATNGYSSESLAPWLAARFLPVQSSVMMTRVLSAEERAAAGWTTDLMAYDTRHLLHYFRLMPDGRFLFGMRGGITASPAHEAKTRARLRRHFEAMFPAWRHVDTSASSSGLACLTGTGLPYVGPVPGLSGAFFAGGYHGNGVAMGSYAGTLAGQLMRRVDKSPVALSQPPKRFPLGRRRRLLLRAAYLGYGLLDRL